MLIFWKEERGVYDMSSRTHILKYYTAEYTLQQSNWRDRGDGGVNVSHYRIIRQRLILLYTSQTPEHNKLIIQTHTWHYKSLYTHKLLYSEYNTRVFLLYSKRWYNSLCKSSGKDVYRETCIIAQRRRTLHCTSVVRT